ncbi:MAG TPA: ABC transporter permease subunit [Bacteroidota bacterium]|nr:ABC transporter permease subunit [Bacteroidota bacterium]
MLLRYEILKTYSKWRTYIGFLAILVLIPVVEIGLKLEGGGILRRMTRELSQDFLLVGNLFNAYFVTLFIMNSLWVHVPFLITLVAGDQLAGEATAGTFRLMLIRPVSRSRILFVKYATTLLYVCSLVAFLALLSLGVGMALFGTGDLLVPGRVLVVLPGAELPWRMVLAFGLATLSMWCVASLAFLFSSLVENAIGPIIGTMAVIIGFIIISNIPVELFAALKPYLFTTYFTVWQKAFEQPIPWETIAGHGAILVAFCVGFYLMSWYIFIRKDVLS